MGLCCTIEKPLESPVIRNAPKGEFQWFRLGFFILLSGLAMTITLAVNIDPPQGRVRDMIHTVLAGITLTSFFLLGVPILKRLSFTKVTLEHLFILSIIGTLSASLYSSLTGNGHIYYEVVLILLTIYHFGELIIKRFEKKVSDHAKLVPGLVTQVKRRTANGVEVIPVSQVQTGDEVLVSPAETIPVDGFLIEGTAFIEDRSHTGEPFPRVMKYGDKVLAGSKVLDGEIYVKSLGEGTSREIDRLFQSLMEIKPSETSCHSQKLLRYFVPFILLMVLTTFTVWSFIGTMDRAIFYALSVCIVACPCALGLGIPLATKNALLQLKLFGIHPKRTDFLTKLAEVDTIIYDKTGTLTASEIELEYFTFHENPPEKLEAWLTAIQRESSHPVAKPFWKLSSPTKPQNLTIDELPGIGVKARFTENGVHHVVEIGNQHILSEDEPENDHQEGRKLFILLNNKLVATAHLKENILENTALHLKTLSESYTQFLLTGDTHCPQVFRTCMDKCYTALKAQEKKNVISEFKKHGRTPLYIGDGQNDTEAMAESHLSLCLSDGGRIARSLADGELKSRDLKALQLALSFSKEHSARVNHLYAFTISYNLIGVSIAALGLLHPIIAAVLMLLASFTALIWAGSPLSRLINRK